MSTEDPDFPLKRRIHPGATMAYGYIPSPDDPLVLIPDPEMAPHIKAAFDYIDDGQSLRKVAEWLESVTGKKISHQGINRIWKERRGSNPKNAREKDQRKSRRAKAPKTGPEKAKARVKRKISDAKRIQTMNERKLSEWVDPVTGEKSNVSAPYLSDSLDYDAAPPEQKVVFRPNPGPQTEFLAANEREVLYGGAAGGGKGLKPDAGILTPFGWRKLKDLSVGSRISSVDGSTTTIIGYYPRGTQTFYRVTFLDGSVVECDEDHLWLTHTAGTAKKLNGTRVFGPDGSKLWTTLQMFYHYEKGGRRLGVPICGPTQFTVSGTKKGPDRFIKRDLDPYLLGVLLGDGSLTHKGNATFTSEDPEIAERIGSTLGVFLSRYDTKSNAYAYRIPSAFVNKPLEDLDLWGKKSENKRIPRIYLLGTEDQRWDLLQGLMDSDGYADEDGDAFFCSVSEGLVDDVRHLARSLGCLVYKITKSTRYYEHNGERREGQTAYDLRIKCPTPEKLFHLSRKKARVAGKQHQSMANWIVSVEKIEDAESICIAVDHPSRLFITDNFVVTHNSYALLADPMRYVYHPEFMGLILRRTNDELRELIFKGQQLYTKAFTGVKWSERKSQFTFPSGARLWLTYLERPEDVLRYQGQSFCYIGLDEITQYSTPFAWDYMRSRLRTTAKDLPTYMRATTNPGGPGHCLTHGEVLTPDRGWVDIKDMKSGDAIFSVKEDGSLFETIVDHTYKEWVEENIVKVNARGLSMSITQDHKVARVGGNRFNRGAAYTLTPFSDLPGQTTILRSVSFQGNSVEEIEIAHSGGRKRRWNQPHVLPVDDYAALVGWYVSEGYRVERDKAVGISQCKGGGRQEIKSLLDRLGYKYCETATAFIIYCPSLYEHMARYGDLCRNKTLTREFKALPTSSLNAFFDAAMMGDGCGSYYYTTSKQLADDFSEVALKIGRIVYTSTRQRDNRVGLSYQVSTKTTKSGGTELLTGSHLYFVSTETKRRSDVTKVPYAGYVYCVGIPETHTFLARQDGSVWVSGNTWVKKTFIDPAPPNTPFAATNIATGEPLIYPDGHARAGEALFYRRFIPASLYDNPYLMDDGQYEANLLSLPENQKRQLLYGDWAVADGAAFSEFRTSTHVIEPYEIPANWRRFRSCDYGYSSFSAVHWFAIDPAYETLIVYRELHVSKHTGRDLAKVVLEMEEGDRIDYGVLDSSAWHQRGQLGPSIAEEMIAQGCRWRPSDRTAGARINGKNLMHERLKVDPETGKPGIVFFNTCRHIIATLPVIPMDPKGGEDIDPRFADDHAYDSVRYGVMSRPRAFSAFSDPHNRVPQQDYKPFDPVFGA